VPINSELTDVAFPSLYLTFTYSVLSKLSLLIPAADNAALKSDGNCSFAIVISPSYKLPSFLKAVPS